MHTIWRDAAYGLRALRREKVFSLTALLTLTLGIATTTTVFSVVDAELWRPLPFPQADRLVAVRATKAGGKYEFVSGGDYLDWRAQSRLARYTATASPARRIVRIGNRPESATVRPVSPDFLAVLGVAPKEGRDFAAADPRVAILSDTGWTRLFDRAPGVVGQTVTIDDEAHVVIGVLAGARFEFMADPDLFVPLDLSTPAFRDRTSRTLDLYARVAGGGGLGEAQAELQSLAARTNALATDGETGRMTQLIGLQEASSGFNWREMYFFFGAAVLVLALACLNVAGLLLARALRRQREFAIRGALGGGRAALVRQLFVEGALVAVPGAATGTLVASWLLALLRHRIPAGLLERGGHLQLDARAVMFVLGLCAACTILVALAPLLFARRIDLNATLGHSGRTSGPSTAQRRTRSVLVGAQLTATFVLLVGAGLFARSFIELARTPLGFEPDNRAAIRVSLSGAQYATDAAIVAFAERLTGEARAIAGVSDAAVGSSSPLDSRSGAAVQIVVPERPRPARGQEPTALIRAVSPGYFRTLGMRRLSGRDLMPGDVSGAPRVAVVNELLAKRIFPGEDPIGRRLEIIPRLRTGWTNRPGTITIVGVVGDARNFGINEVDFNCLYLPFEQAPAPSFELLAATTLPIGDAIGPLRDAVRRIDPSLPLLSVSALTDRVDSALRADRFNLLVIAFFATAATLLAAVGIYGAVACSVQERTREFGIRVALGGTRGRILRTAVSSAMRTGVAGAAAGAAAALTIARLLGDALYLVPGDHVGMLYHVSTTDPLTLVSAIVLLLAVVTAAALGPARQATRVDPMVALRSE